MGQRAPGALKRERRSRRVKGGQKKGFLEPWTEHLDQPSNIANPKP